MRQASVLKKKVDDWFSVHTRQEDVAVLYELAVEEDDESALDEVEAALRGLQADVERLELSALLTGEYDSAGAIVSIHPGAGGTESQDWAEMLLRMYTRWADAHGYIKCCIIATE
jgi:peptide chain release factor 2